MEGKTLIRQNYSPPTDVKLDRTPQAANAIMEDSLMSSSPEDLSDILSGDEDSLAVENIVLHVRPETPEIPWGHLMDEELATLESLLFLQYGVEPLLQERNFELCYARVQLTRL